ncbi:hypothetical protein DVH05_000012 [Phytophthora capsici]|nr:hypothetical protein DVH05_000012 [Phytophthora capsici]
MRLSVRWKGKSTQYDPRALLAGKVDEATGKWVSGLMNKDSSSETLDGWTKSVIVGRVRLGGILVGVVVTEVLTPEKNIPADAVIPASQENLMQQAGQVWFPDSVHKTATVIKDFKGEDLPLFILANWRGFSGGQRDMFDEVLKFGAAIVDGFVNYELPVFVYISPFAEQRGGAWAVVDRIINEGIMEIQIKYSKKQLLQAMYRQDD